MKKIQEILIYGAGTMGKGIAYVSALSGRSVRVFDTSSKALNTLSEFIESTAKKAFEIGKIAREVAEAIPSRVQAVRDAEKCAATSDLILEAAPEDLGLKCEIFEKLGAVAPRNCIFASNTSSLSIGEMGRASGRPDRFLGMHFFNPVPKMRLVEIVRGEETSSDALEPVRALVSDMGKESVVVKDSPGFVTSRMNALIGNEAFKLLEAGIASARDIDAAIKLGLNHPMGPFEMVDLVGLDVRLSIMKYLHAKLGEAYRPNAILEKLVSEGRLGRKVGRGVYDYDTDEG